MVSVFAEMPFLAPKTLDYSRAIILYMYKKVPSFHCSALKR